MLLMGRDFGKRHSRGFTACLGTLHLLLAPLESLNFNIRVMRIAIVTEAFLPQVNGVTNSVLRLLEFSRAKGDEVLVIAPESEGAPDQYLGYKIKHIPSIALKNLIPLGVPSKYLEPLIEGFDPDVIHLASPIFMGRYVTKFAKRLGIPTVSVYQTDIAGFARHYGLTIAHSSIWKWVSRIHQNSDITLVPSEWSKRELESHGVSNIRIWKRGVDIRKFSPDRRDVELRKELVNGSQKKIVGYVGRLANEKRIDELAILDKQSHIQLVIVGIGPAENKLRKALPNAHFVGYKSGDELGRYVASFDLFVHTGKHETFCQSIQESLSAGVPVIAPNSGGPVDLIHHGVNGLLIDTSDSIALLNSVNILLAYNNFEALKVAARESVQHRTWDYINAQIFDHYRDAIQLVKAKNEVAA